MKSTVKTKLIKLVLQFNAQQQGLLQNCLSVTSNKSADENFSDERSSAVWGSETSRRHETPGCN